MTATPVLDRRNLGKRPLSRKLRRLPLHAFLFTASMAMLFPFIVMVLTSLKPNEEVYQNPIGLPWAPTLGNFATSWTQAGFPTLFANSLFLTLTSMTAATLVVALAAYGIARTVNRLGSLVYLVIAVGIFLPMQLALIPQFRVVKELGLIDNYLGVIFIYISMTIPFGVFLVTAFMRQLPHEIVEAATLDGCGYLAMFWRIYFPLARPAAATFWILQGVQVWNDYLVPQLILTDPSRRTLTTGILVFKQQYLAQWGNIMAGVVIMTLPVVLLFLFLQRHFLRGIYAGSVK